MEMILAGVTNRHTLGAWSVLARGRELAKLREGKNSQPACPPNWLAGWLSGSLHGNEEEMSVRLDTGRASKRPCHSSSFRGHQRPRLLATQSLLGCTALKWPFRSVRPSFPFKECFARFLFREEFCPMLCFSQAS